jgi:hypothetical protein
MHHDARDTLRRMSRSIQWRFSVRSVLGVIAVIGAFLAISRWQTPFHASCLYVAGSLAFLGTAGCLRRKRWAYAAIACLGVSAGALLLCWYGPASLEESVCRICGKERTTATYFGMTWPSRECETELSEWYQNAGLPPHAHNWRFLCSWEQYWGGGQLNNDSFGFWLVPLKRFRDTSAQMDRTTFEDLARKLRIVCEEAADEDFLPRCEEILPVDEATDSGQ